MVMQVCSKYVYKGYTLEFIFTDSNQYCLSKCTELEWFDSKYPLNREKVIHDFEQFVDLRIRCQPFEYRGFVLVPTFNSSGHLTKATCYEIDFSMYQYYLTYSCTDYSIVINLFKDKVDKILEEKTMSNSDAEKELNRLRTLLKEQPAVFYGTRQVYDLLTLAEDLLAGSKKQEENEDPSMKEYHKQLDRVVEWDNKLKYSQERLQLEVTNIYLFFKGVLNFTLSDVKRHYCERANKE